MEEKMNILLISRDESCATEVTDFLLKSQCIFATYGSNSSNDAGTITEYAYRDGPPTVIRGSGCGDLRVYYVLKCFNDIQSHYDRRYKYDAIILFLYDNVDNNNLILDYIVSPNYLNYLKQSHNLTIIGNLSQPIQQSITNQFECESSMWRWNGKFAYNWSTDLCTTNNLWIHINKKNNYRLARVSYISETILRSIISLFGFFKKLVYMICFNVWFLGRGMDTRVIQLLTLNREGDSYEQQYKKVKDLLIQFNIVNLSDFDRLLKKEMKQLACHLSQLASFCDEIVNFTGDLHSVVFHNFCGLKVFKDLYYGELQIINMERITNLVVNSLDAMSKMKFTGRYIKDVLGIEKLILLKSCLERHYSFKNIKIDEGKQNTQPENRNQNIHIENRIGNIQLLKSLQKTIQEFTDELKQVRQVQEVVTKDIKEMKEKLNCKCNNLKQQIDESGSRTNK